MLDVDIKGRIIMKLRMKCFLVSTIILLVTSGPFAMDVDKYKKMILDRSSERLERLGKMRSGDLAEGTMVLLCGGTNVGGGTISSDISFHWCCSSAVTLEEYLSLSKLKLNSTGSYYQANKILVNGMIAGLKSNNKSAHTFTFKALERGLQIASFLGVGKPYNCRKANWRFNNILKKYYKFVLKHVSRDLDLNGYVPYLEAQSNLNIREFESRFVKYASSQLIWMNDNLTTGRIISGEGEIAPVGDASDYLLVAQLMSIFTAEDLINSLWNKRFTCAIEKLINLHDIILRYDPKGNHEMSEHEYEDDRIAVNMVSYKLEEIIKKISSNDSCL